jgi:hypothetical protein
MPPIALVLYQNARNAGSIAEYYGQVPWEPTKTRRLAIDRVQSFGADFRSLVTMLRAEARSHVIIAAHGNPWDGLTMPLSRTVAQMSGACMYELVRTVDRMDNKTITDSYLDGVATSWGATRAGRPDRAAVMELAQICYDIRHSKETCVQVHIRACDVGNYKGTSDMTHVTAWRRLFNSGMVSAPMVPMLYAPVSSEVVSSVENWKGTHTPRGRRYTYKQATSGPMALDVEYMHETSRARCAVEKRADIAAWIKVFQERSVASTTTTFALAAMFPDNDDDYFLPHEPWYVQSLNTVTAG